FLVNPKCVGGYFATAQDQIKDAVYAGLRILKGEKPEDIGLIESQPSWNINWDVLRPMGLNVNLVPSYVSLHNDKLKDRNPQLYEILFYAAIIGLIVLMIWSGVIIFIYGRRARKNAIKLRDYATETISNNKTLEQMMAIADFRTWEQTDDDEKQFSRISASEFFMDKLRYFLRIGKPGNYNLQIHCSIDGKPASWYELRMTVSRENDKIARRGVIINIESQKEVEAMAAETNRLINSVRTREGFIASMNHEIRTPLNSVVGYSQLLAMVDMPLEEEEILEYGATIKENTTILQNTINNILISNKIGKGLISPEIEISRLSDIIVPEQISELEQDDNGRIIMGQCDKNLFVKADADMLKTVINNLLSNALRFSDSSSKVKLGWTKRDDPDYSAEITVRDEGIGIAPEYFELIFDRFVKVDSFTPGCGLGLYICKTFVETMGGQISVESKVGEGSVFKIKLP
ncbi:MAG: sensor histidine kinase, partial [Candidatus Cryptobacteroides sp.]